MHRIFIALLAASTLFGTGRAVAQGGGAFGVIDGVTDGLLLAAGPVTVFPLLMFLQATQRLRLSTVGLIQYLTPTLQFLLAVAVYREPFTAIHLAAFGCIWLALALYSTDAWFSHRALQPSSLPRPFKGGR